MADLRASTKTDYIDALTGLRFCAAFCVLLSHSLGTFFGPVLGQSQILLYLSAASGVGMTLFFILSGFVIHYTYSEAISASGTQGWRNYAVARFARLYPLYFVCLVYALFQEAQFADLKPLTSYMQSAPYYLTLTQVWSYKLIGPQELSQVHFPISWSISTEAGLYWLYPLVFLLLMRIGTLRGYMVAAIATFGVGATLCYLAYHYLDPINAWAVHAYGPAADWTTNNSESFVRYLTYFSPYARLSEFTIGACAAAIHMNLRDRPIARREARMASALLIAAIAYVLVVYGLMFSHKSYGWFHDFIKFSHRNVGLAPGLAFIVFFCARYRKHPLSRMMSWRPLIKLGDASYSLYLLHIWILSIGSPNMAIGLSFEHVSLATVRMLGTMAFAIVVSLSFYQVVEVPARAAVRRWLMPQKSPSAALSGSRT